MSWFLTKKSGSKTRKRTSKRGTQSSWDPARTLLGLKILGVIVAVGGAWFGWQWMENALETYASHRLVNPVHVELADRPAWMTDEVAQRVESIVLYHTSENPMDGQSLTTAAKALLGCPWVGEVHQVRRVREGRVVVEADYRQPVAQIQDVDGVDYLVDATGHWLQTRDQAYGVLPRITGVAGQAPSYGGSWQGEDVEAALALATMLCTESFMDQVRWIDASSRDAMGRVNLVLHTDRGWVVWGLAPGHEKVSGVNAGVKVRRLRQLARSEGSIDDGGRGVYLNRPTIMTARSVVYE